MIAANTAPLSHGASETALLLMDPHQKFRVETETIPPFPSEIAASVRICETLRAVVAPVPNAGIAIFVVLHHEAEQGDAGSWARSTAGQMPDCPERTFASGACDAPEAHAIRSGDTDAAKPEDSDGFASTELAVFLKALGVRKLFLAGIIANRCVEAAALAAVELGYHVTLARDATAAFGMDAAHAAHDVDDPSFAQAVLRTTELLTTLARDKGPCP